MKVARKGEKLFLNIITIIMLVVFLASFTFGIFSILK